MKAIVRIVLNGENRKISIRLHDYSYVMAVAEIEARFHSAMQTKTSESSHFDDQISTIPESLWVFDKKYTTVDYKIQSIEIISENSQVNFEGESRKTYDHYPNFKTPEFKRKPRLQKQDQIEMDLEK